MNSINELLTEFTYDSHLYIKNKKTKGGIRNLNTIQYWKKKKK